MKKYLLFAILIFIMFALTACGSNDYEYTVTDTGVTIIKYTGDASEIEVPSTIKKKPVTSIGDYAFADQFNLKNVIIPQSVTSIGEGVFYNCNNLFSVAIPDRATCNSNAFKSCNIQNSFKYNVIAGGEAIITGHDGTATDVEIPSFIGKYPVTRIGEDAFAEEDFYNGIRLTSIVIPEGVKSIGQSAFEYCKNLISVSIPTSVTNIGGWAFFCCENLTTEIVIPHGVTNIERSTFYGCKKLTSVVIPASVTSIGQSAFQNCYSLTSVVIPASVTSIGESVFEDYNSRILSNLNLYCEPNSYAERYARINGIKYKYTISDSERYEDFEYVISNNKAVITGYNGSATKVEIPSVIEGYPVTRIQQNAFDNCRNLTNVVIPSDITIDDDAFSNCNSSMYILKYRVSNGKATITDCILENRADVVIPSIIGEYPVTSIGDYAFYSCESLRNVTIPNSVTSIGDDAFYSCKSLTSVTIPNSVTSIGDDAFAYCSSLTSVTIPNSVTSISNSAFAACSSLTSVTIPNSVTSIGDYAFRGCSSLTSVTIPDSVTGIGNSAFAGCSSLTSVTIPDSVTRISDAFHNCSSLTSVYILGSKTRFEDSILNDVFEDCDNLTIWGKAGSEAQKYAKEHKISFREIH